MWKNRGPLEQHFYCPLRSEEKWHCSIAVALLMFSNLAKYNRPNKKCECLEIRFHWPDKTNKYPDVSCSLSTKPGIHPGLLTNVPAPCLETTKVLLWSGRILYGAESLGGSSEIIFSTKNYLNQRAFFLVKKNKANFSLIIHRLKLNYPERVLK